MPLQRVYQENEAGCFIAGVASLLGKTYQEAFNLVHPQKSYDDWSHGIEAMSLQDAALNTLQRLGVKAHVSRLRRFNSLRKSKKNMILIIRWEIQPTRCHTIVYDAESRQILDPDPCPAPIKDLERQLDFAIAVDEIAIPIHGSPESKGSDELSGPSCSSFRTVGRRLSLTSCITFRRTSSCMSVQLTVSGSKKN